MFFYKLHTIYRVGVSRIGLNAGYTALASSTWHRFDGHESDVGQLE